MKLILLKDIAFLFSVFKDKNFHYIEGKIFKF